MFKFKGISSNNMRVIVEEEEHFIARARQRYEITEIEGKDDAIFNEQGYSYIERPILIQCLDVNKIDDILSWLDGSGELEYKGRKTMARFYAELEPERRTSIRVIDTNFIRAPFWYKADDEFVNTSNEVINEGTIISRPIIRIEKTNSNYIELAIGSVRFTYNFENDDWVEIDCEEKTIKYNGIDRNRQIIIGYEFPKLQPGKNNVFLHSGEAIIKMKRKDRWL